MSDVNVLIYCILSWCCVFCVVFFFKQKTAYEMRISDWSSDVCSSDLLGRWPFGGYAASGDRVREALTPLFAADGTRLASAPDGWRLAPTSLEIGRASCRERVCQYV